MKNYAYNVNAYGENDGATFRTNDVRAALDTFLEAKSLGIHCDLLNGCTGEVMAIANCPDCKDYATDEATLMIKGMAFEALGGEEIALEAEEDEPACSQCGGPVNANGACQHCGVVDDTLRAEEDGSEVETMDPYALFELLGQLGGLLS